MKKIFTIAALSLPMFYQLPVLAADADNLKVKLTEINSLKADFNQTVTDINDKVIQTGEGVFALSHPNQFYWHLTAPDESLIVADGTDVWVYNPFAEEVSVMDINQAISASPIALLVHSDDATWSQYKVAQTDNCFDISPKDADSGVSEVQVCFDDKQLTQMVLKDQQGNISDFKLTNQSSIADTDRDLFKFVVPDDVDIDDQRLKLTN
ncbi:outer-membrane lipoprotein carrier protein [Shewanella sairae]|uniref:Outer-membrane lipoprotein carrier protein n=1 Tax=Shewanella sairae TaxID=190310 RepID=A0ABQ4PJQ7_9GAMM|nr:outer membrane lipoprotein chaperone LolA [Shewanella sairae]MCL1129888.1 outer membrane lipoprotein chaperone LolA [Shewanella sairae]GIU48017.1 outer-membrane lipoprotein carrier protein [Shewanella sairae]